MKSSPRVSSKWTAGEKWMGYTEKLSEQSSACRSEGAQGAQGGSPACAQGRSP